MTPRKSGRIRGNLLRAVAIVALAAAIAFALLLFDSVSGRDWQMKKVVIPRKSTLADITSLFRQEKILPHPLAFRALVLLTGTSRRLHYGEYTFPAPPSAFETWRRIVAGDVIKYSVTVPPGANLFDIASLLGEMSLADPKAFLDAATSRDTLARLGIRGKSAEGYLFPDTYVLVKTLSPEEILEIMVRQFWKKFTPETEKRAKEEGLTVSQVVTIASIIEKETSTEEEKPLVSAVIRKRLALGMPLQMDPTVIYGAKRFDGTVTRKDLQAEGPYNTYRNRGLPPGPIANPGMPAILAALAPAKTDYLYFVSNNDGSHVFSRTLPEHLRAVEKFRRSVRAEKR